MLQRGPDVYIVSNVLKTGELNRGGTPQKELFSIGVSLEVSYLKSES